MNFHFPSFKVNKVTTKNIMDVIVTPYPAEHLLIIANIPKIIPSVNIKNIDCLIVMIYFFQM